MRFIRAAFARLTGMFTRFNADDDLRAELESHIDMQTAENVRRGMTPHEARRQAILASGGVTQAVEAVHDRAGVPWIESIAADIKYGLRSLRHTPGFTAVVMLTLALGIGANTAIFSVVRGVLLKPLPNREGDKLVYLRHSQGGLGGEDITFSVPEVRDLRGGTTTLAGVAEVSSWSLVYQGTEGAVRWQVGLVTGNYFEVMGLSPVLGRLTIPNTDDGPGSAPIAVLTYETWVNRFGADTAIVGKDLNIGNKKVRVVGVLQPSPFFPDKVDAFLNMVNSEHHMGAQMQNVRVHRMTRVLARLKPSANLAQSRADVDAVYARMQKQNPDAYDAASKYNIEMVPFREALGERASFTLWLLMAAAALVLIITVANVGNLTLMRGVRREHELVVRAALGAGTLRLRRLLLVENLLMALIGAGLGITLAVAGVKLLASFAARYSPRASEISLDGVVLSFTVALSIAVALVLSFLSWTPVEGKLAGWIASGARRMTGGLRKQRLQRGLVVAQVAMSVVLLAGAGLLTRTLIRLSNVQTGLRTDQVLTLQLSIPNPGARDTMARAAARRQFGDIKREIASLPGVIDVGTGSTLPLRVGGNWMEVEAEGRPRTPGQPAPRADWRGAEAHFFEASGIPLLAGRNFTGADEPIQDSVVIVNKTFAERVFPGEDPVGHRMMFNSQVLKALYPEAVHWRTIVGVVGDTRDGELDASPAPVVFAPFFGATASGGIAIRADGNVANLIPATTKIVRRIAPTALVEDMQTIQQYKTQKVSNRRLNATLISSFAMLALLIAAVGIGGVLAFSVSSRVNEIGIRMSLGADPGTVERMILMEGGSLVGIGLLVGLSGALVGGRIIQGMLYDVAPNDPMTLVVAAAIMSASGVIACWIPALRAARVDPAITMRAQ